MARTAKGRIEYKLRNVDFQVAKLMLQRRDRAYYLETLGFRPFAWQKEIANAKAKRLIINGARQIGKSTIVAMIPAHTARFFPGSLSMIGAPTENQAVETMRKVMAFIAMDRDYPPLKRNSTEEIELENGSRILVRSANSDTFRGYSMPRVIILDEASRVTDEAYTSGVRPMLTDNPDCELILISTPFGREGFFYEAFTGNNAAWYRAEVRSPYQPVGEGSEMTLEPYMQESEYIAELAERGIRAWFSPRHMDYDFQLDQLSEMKLQQYLQEYCVNFVEKSGQVFKYDEIDDAFRAGRNVQLLKGYEPRHIKRVSILESVS